MNKLNLALIGASGLVGLTMLKVLDESDLEIDNLYLFASHRSAGKKLLYKGKKYVIQELREDSFDQDINFALFATSEEISKKYIEIALAKGVCVIDNSSKFRMNEDVPLVVAGVNDNLINKDTKLVSNPNCSTIQAIVALAKLQEEFRIKRIIYNTYQAVSGSGTLGVLDLINGIEGKVNMFYKKQIAFNLIPEIGSIKDNGYTSEENKMIEETKKILSSDIEVTATCVRVPVINSHSISINVECINDIDLDKVVDYYKNDPNIQYYENEYPTPKEVSGSDIVHIGRLRKDTSNKNCLNMWVVADNLRIGAATNAVNILKRLWKEKRDVI